jgi:hypothetical protein
MHGFRTHQKRQSAVIAFGMVLSAFSTAIAEEPPQNWKQIFFPFPIVGAQRLRRRLILGTSATETKGIAIKTN